MSRTPLENVIENNTLNNTLNNTNTISRFPEEINGKPILKTPKKTHFDKNPDNIDFYNCWSKFSQLQTNKLETVKRHWMKKHNDILKDYTANDIFYAIDQYAFIKNNDMFWYNYDRSIWEFIDKGLVKFTHNANPVQNFARNKGIEGVTTEELGKLESKWNEEHYHIQEEFTRKE